VVEQAVSDRVGQVEFCVGSVKAFHDMIVNPTYSYQAKHTVNVPVTTIDAFWQDAGRPDISLIKIDTEGAEFQALQGASECLRACRPTLLVECSEPHLRAHGHQPSGIFEWVHGQGYSMSCLPNVIPIRSAAEFQIHLLFQYNFLLLPL
jgi:hypothetical protein